MGASTSEIERLQDLLRLTTDQLAAVSKDKQAAAANSEIIHGSHSRRRGSVGNVPNAQASALDQGGTHRRQSLAGGHHHGGLGSEGVMNLEDTR